MESKIKYIRGVPKRGEEVQALIQKHTNDKYAALHLPSIGDILEDPKCIIFWEDPDGVANWFCEGSVLGELIIKNGEELKLDPIKFQLHDKVRFFDYGAECEIEGLIVKREIRDGRILYTISSPNLPKFTCAEKYEEGLELVESVEDQPILTYKDLVGRPLYDAYYINDHSEIVPYDDDVCRAGEKYVAGSEKVAKAMLAMAQLSLLLPHYGGDITSEEWQKDTEKYIIYRSYFGLDYDEYISNYHFVAFRDPDERDRFMSEPENVRLLKDLFMMD